MRWLVVVLGMSGCATLNTANMSEPCARMYNACLDNCAKAQLPSAAPATVGNNTALQIEVATCTDGCNARAKSCL